MRRTHLAALPLVVTVSLSGSGARADTIEFAGGFFTWSDPQSWNNLDGPDHPPGPGDTALFNLGGGGYNFFLDVDATCLALDFATNSATCMSLGGGSPHSLTLTEDAVVSGDQLQLSSLNLAVGGDLTVNNGASLWALGSNVTVDGYLGVGLGAAPADGTFVVSGTSALTVSGATFVGGTAGNGTLTFQGGATGNLQSLSVPASSGGATMTGTVNVNFGSTVSTGPVLVATVTDNGASGDVFVNGAGSVLDPGTDPMTVGAESGSVGRVIVPNGGLLKRRDLSVTVVRPTGQILLMSAGTLELDGTLIIDGGMVSTLFGGVLALDPDSGNQPQVHVESKGLLNLGGSFTWGGVSSPATHQDIFIRGGSEARVEFDWRMGPDPGTFCSLEISGVHVADGIQSRLMGAGGADDLVIGDGGNGTVLVDSGGLVDNFDDVIVGNLSQAGGSLTVTGQGGLGFHSTVSADGTVYVGGGPGTVGGANGQVFLEDDGRIFADAVQVARLPGSEAGLTIGNPSGQGLQTAVLTTSGRVDIGGDGTNPGGTAELTMWSNSAIDAGLEVQVWPGSTMTLQGGTVFSESDIVIGPQICSSEADDGGLAVGYGTLDVGFNRSVICCGRLAPGGVADDGATQPALIEIQGDYTQWGFLDIELGGTNGGVTHDQLVVSGTAVLSGVIEVSLAAGYMPAAGSSYDILVAQSVQLDGFSPVSFVLPPGVEAAVLADRVRLTAVCIADLDGDEIVGINDFLDLLAAWGTNPGGPPDLDGDGTVGIADFLLLLAAWGPCT